MGLPRRASSPPRKRQSPSPSRPAYWQLSVDGVMVRARVGWYEVRLGVVCGSLGVRADRLPLRRRPGVG